MILAQAPTPFGHPNYKRNRDSFTPSAYPWRSPCAWCGKAVKDSEDRLWVHVVDGGAAFGSGVCTDHPGDMGLHPVGATCAKLLRRAGVAIL